MTLNTSIRLKGTYTYIMSITFCINTIFPLYSWNSEVKWINTLYEIK